MKRGNIGRNAVRVLPAAMCLGIGSVSVAGWLVHFPDLAALMPGGPVVPLMTAIVIMVQGLATAFPAGHPLRRSLSVLVIGLTAASVVDQWLPSGLGVDWNFAAGWLGAERPNAALMPLFGAVPVAFLAYCYGRPSTAATAALTPIQRRVVLAIAVLAILTLIERLLDLRAIYDIPGSNPVTLPGVACTLALVFGLLAQPPRGETAPDAAQAARSIRATGAWILIAISLLAGCIGLSAMRRGIEATLRTQMTATIDGLQSGFQAAINEKLVTGRLISSRRIIGRYIKQIETDTARADGLASILRIAQSYLPFGIKGIRFIDRADHTVAEVGTFAGDADLGPSLNGTGGARLVWSNGLRLRQTEQILDESGQDLGLVVIEQELTALDPILKRAAALGATGHSRVCAADLSNPDRLDCLPDETQLTPFTIDRKLRNGGPQPISRAIDGASGVIETLNEAGNHVVAAYAPIGGLGLGLLISVETAELFAPLRDLVSITLPLLVLVVVIGTTLLAARVAPITRRLVASESEARARSIALTSSEFRLRTLVDTVGEAIVTIDETGIIRSFNPAAARMFQCAAEDVIGQSMKRLVPAESHAAFDADLRRQNQMAREENPASLSLNALALRRDGSLMALEMTMASMVEDGAKLHVGIMRDVSERRQAETALEAARQELQEKNRVLDVALNNMAQGLVLYDHRQRLLAFNRRYQILMGFPDHVLLTGLTHRDVLQRSLGLGSFPVEDGIGGLLARARPGGERQKIERRMSDGRIIEIAGQPLDDGGGVFSLTDVTEARQADQALRRAKAQAEAASRAKSEFLSMMSHEIRTPMNGVLGMTRILINTGLDAQQRLYAETARNSAEALLAIIDDILDFSRLEAGRLSLEAVPFGLNAVVDAVVTLLRPRADEKALTLAVIRSPGLPEWLIGDGNRLRQILLNLLGNAIKFTATGRVTLRIETQGIDPARVLIRFEIIDTGPGIAPEILPNLFRRFTQADSSISRKFGGTGLGLAITHQLAEMMDGRVGVESVLGEGSVFRVELPFPLGSAPALAEPAPVRPGPAAHALNILVAEDNPVNQMVLSAMLDPFGHTVSMVENGRQAVDAVMAGGFDLVFMDIQMPEMDGVAATKAIRALSPPVPIVIIALTANAMSGDREQYLAAGMDDYLSKPLDPKALAACLARWADRQDQAPPPPDTRSPPLPAPSAETAMPVLAQDRVNELSAILPAAKLHALFEAFLSETAPRIARLRDTRDGATLRAFAHDLAGSAGNYGLAELAGMAQHLLAACRQGDMAAAISLAETIPAAFERAQCEILALIGADGPEPA